MKTVVIVDDHILVAKALTNIIEKFGDFKVLLELENGKQVVDRFRNNNFVPDILLLDINMPMMDGFETAKWVTEHHPDVKILALSVQDDENSLIKMIRSGACGYLLKNVRPIQLKEALNSVIDKGYFYPEWITHKVIQKIVHPEDASITDINGREREFLGYVASEMTYKEIAEEMCCSPRTVETYRDSLFR